MSQFNFKLLFCCAYRLNENAARFNAAADACCKLFGVARPLPFNANRNNRMQMDGTAAFSIF